MGENYTYYDIEIDLSKGLFGEVIAKVAELTPEDKKIDHEINMRSTEIYESRTIALEALNGDLSHINKIVKYVANDDKESKESKEFKELELSQAHYDGERDKYDKKNDVIHYHGIKSKLVTCTNCESKLSTKYINTNQCPMCNNEMRPKTLMDTLDVLMKNMKKAESDLIKKQKKYAAMKNGIKAIVRLELVDVH